MTDTKPHGALQSLVVLDLTQMLAGPYASMILADQGAHVVKIEPPGGDPTRRLPPHLPDAVTFEDGGYGGYFASINRNKESLVLDLKSADGRQVFERLVAKSDVVIENFRAGVMDRLGLSYERLRAIQPSLVYGAIRGFGDPRTGVSPYVNWPAYDVVAQAMGGIMAITSPFPGGLPTKIGPGVGDIIPAMMAVVAILSAVHHARETGEGQFVDVAMIDCVVAACERIVFQLSYTGEVPRAEGNGHPLMTPFGLFPAADGHVAIACPHDNFWIPLARIIGGEKLVDDPKFLAAADRQRHRAELEKIVETWTMCRTKAEIAFELGGVVPFGPVRRADEIVGDAHAKSRELVAEVEHPGASRTVSIASTPIRMTATQGKVWKRAPLTGEHTHIVLKRFGFSPDECLALFAAGVTK